MHERDAFEARFHGAVDRYVGRVWSDLDPVEFAHRIAVAEPRHHRLGAIVGRRGVAVPQLAWVLLLLAALLALTMAELPLVGSKPAWKLDAVVSPTAPVPWPAWEPASSADTALVDRMNEILTLRDAAAVDEVYADDLVYTVEGEVYGGLEGLRENMPEVTVGRLSRVGDVTTTVAPVPGLWNLPPGSRYLAFVEQTGGELRDFVLEVNAEDRIVVSYNDGHRQPSERAREGYSRVAFMTISGEAARSVGSVARNEAVLTIVETDALGESDMAGCQEPADGSAYVFLHLRMEATRGSFSSAASDAIQILGPGGERLEPASCQREPVFQLDTGAWDGWIAVAAPPDAAGRLSLVYRHVNETPSGQEPEVHEALIPFDLPPA